MARGSILGGCGSGTGAGWMLTGGAEVTGGNGPR
jgi:hypothetical protein